MHEQPRVPRIEVERLGRLAGIRVERLGRLDYARGLEWQRGAVEAVREGGPERVALLEHAPVYTLGARGRRDALRLAEASMPAPLLHSDRGGDVTFHGPGQLVAYPVLDLRVRGLHAGDYVRALEETLIEALAAFDLAGRRWPGRPGVWLEDEGAPSDLAKVAAIGVRVQGGITRHGLALNVTTDLRWFEAIVPCGIEDAGVTSMARALAARGAAPAMPAVERALVEAFARVFDSTVATDVSSDGALTPVLSQGERAAEAAEPPSGGPARPLTEEVARA